MPIVRKLIVLGTSKGVTLPISWLRDQEKKAGHKIEAIAIEVDNVLTLQAVIEKEEEPKRSAEDSSSSTERDSHGHP